MIRNSCHHYTKVCYNKDMYSAFNRNRYNPYYIRRHNPYYRNPSDETKAMKTINGILGDLTPCDKKAWGLSRRSRHLRRSRRAHRLHRSRFHSRRNPYSYPYSHPYQHNPSDEDKAVKTIDGILGDLTPCDKKDWGLARYRRRNHRHFRNHRRFRYNPGEQHPEHEATQDPNTLKDDVEALVEEFRERQRRRETLPEPHKHKRRKRQKKSAIRRARREAAWPPGIEARTELIEQKICPGDNHCRNQGWPKGPYCG
jgi:hypothetical protein